MNYEWVNSKDQLLVTILEGFKREDRKLKMQGIETWKN